MLQWTPTLPKTTGENPQMTHQIRTWTTWPLQTTVVYHPLPRQQTDRDVVLTHSEESKRSTTTSPAVMKEADIIQGGITAVTSDARIDHRQQTAPMISPNFLRCTVVATGSTICCMQYSALIQANVVL